jgi:hydroxylamine dehydrogenase
MNGYLRFFCLGVMLLGALLNFNEVQAEEKKTLSSDSSVKTVDAKKPVNGKRVQEMRALQEKLKLKDPIKSFGKNGFCINCHEDETPAIFEEWVKSPHARAGVGCVDCHSSPKGNKDSIKHFERFFISPVVTPYDCAKCHKDQLRDYVSSAHAHSLGFLQKMKKSDPRYVVVEQFKDDDFIQCAGCHGSTLKIATGNRPDSATWPNNGAGRKNHDKSLGTCSSCHLGHGYSLQAVRKPETCLRCHDGDNYPEGDIYRHSVHNTLFKTHADQEGLKRPGLFMEGKDMVAPTCAYCHMNGAGKGLLNRHDQAWRLPRDLSAPNAPLLKRAENLRNNMKSVCNQCHGGNFTENFFTDADNRLQEYQEAIVEPRLLFFQQRIVALAGEERKKTLREYSQFLAEAKRYRMNLYMGRHGRVQR